ncbi:MAG TPA: hypothetical protein VM165_08130, partial [Planctomycetaceae bacterium]|nr:hypothetical protein [Planctomycetaceae bacterium]
MRTCRLWTAALVVAAATLGAVSSAEAQWGSVSGQVVLDGDIPKLKLKVTKGDAMAKDAAVCAAQDVPNEDLVVDPATKGIANVVVYLKKAPAKVHPDLAKPAAAAVTYDHLGCRFSPHVAVVQTTQTVNVISSD